MRKQKAHHRPNKVTKRRRSFLNWALAGRCLESISGRGVRAGVCCGFLRLRLICIAQQIFKRCQTLEYGDCYDLFKPISEVESYSDRQIERSREVTGHFLMAELELTRTFAKIALDSFAAGSATGQAERQRRAKRAYTVRKLVGKVKAEARKPIEARLTTLDPLMKQLAAIE